MRACKACETAAAGLPTPGYSRDVGCAHRGGIEFIVVRVSVARQAEPGTGPYDYVILDGESLTPTAVTLAGPIGVRAAKTLNGHLRGIPGDPQYPIFAKRFALVGDDVVPRGWIQKEATYRLAEVAAMMFRHGDVAWTEPVDGWVKVSAVASHISVIERRYRSIRAKITRQAGASAAWGTFLEQRL
jgi:hypothetical protein